MKKILLLIVIIGFLFTSPIDVKGNEFSWYSHKILKVTIVTEDIYYEWEYENPDSFEYEEGNTIVREQEAKESFKQILTYFDLTRDTITNEQISSLEKNGYESIVRAVVKRVDRNDHFQTWIWNRN
ncbi:hypothetical protein J2S74_002412 [Evansella vedderi]|uniref:Uncharacterized protein n=1 Tax=Evansella vedderi TaxID=38282 RepID=A0ABT9ZUV8_9BACI|nr:hypothetical protein [Evansella vedderi]MDQ0255030.1 hypothetical protein [Evansella vedderi]